MWISLPSLIVHTVRQTLIETFDAAKDSFDVALACTRAAPSSLSDSHSFFFSGSVATYNRAAVYRTSGERGESLPPSPISTSDLTALHLPLDLPERSDDAIGSSLLDSAHRLYCGRSACTSNSQKPTCPVVSSRLPAPRASSCTSSVPAQPGSSELVHAQRRPMPDGQVRARPNLESRSL